jgi:hypothetical protein
LLRSAPVIRAPFFNTAIVLSPCTHAELSRASGPPTPRLLAARRTGRKIDLGNPRPVIRQGWTRYPKMT